MKNAEDVIEKVLAGLRDAAAPEGLERRVVDSLERRESVRMQSARDGRRLGWMIRPLPVFSLMASVGLVFLVFVFLGVERGRHSSERRSGLIPSVKRQEPGVVGGGKRDALGSAPADVSLRNAHVRRLGRAPVRRTGGEAESVEWSEMHAPSRPAPEVPLTEEERQLLRIVHRRDPVELAELKSSVRDERNAREKVEFQDFFESTKKDGGSE